MATHSSVLAWKTPWSEPGGYSPACHKESDTTEQLSTKAKAPHCLMGVICIKAFHPCRGERCWGQESDLKGCC